MSASVERGKWLPRKALEGVPNGALVDLQMGIDERLTGAFFGFSGKSVLIQRFNDDAMKFTGYTVVRATQIKKVRLSDGVIDRYVELKGIRPSPPSFDTAPSIETLLTRLSKRRPIVLIHRERIDSDALWAGVVIDADSRKLRLQEIDPEGKWDDVATEFRVADVTRIEFSGYYEKALRAIGGQPPPIRVED